MDTLLSELSQDEIGTMDNYSLKLIKLNTSTQKTRSETAIKIALPRSFISVFNFMFAIDGLTLYGDEVETTNSFGASFIKDLVMGFDNLCIPRKRSKEIIDPLDTALVEGDTKPTEDSTTKALDKFLFKVSQVFLPVKWGLGSKGGFKQLKGNHTYETQKNSITEFIENELTTSRLGIIDTFGKRFPLHSQQIEEAAKTATTHIKVLTKTKFSSIFSVGVQLFHKEDSKFLPLFNPNFDIQSTPIPVPLSNLNLKFVGLEGTHNALDLDLVQFARKKMYQSPTSLRLNRSPP
jgi:hypothetical protein